MANSTQVNLHEIWEKDPLRDYYNSLEFEHAVLTCDIDWAPDYAIEFVFELVERYGHKITVFATHESPLLLDPPDFVEVGLHPDFTRSDLEGRFDEKLQSLHRMYPDAMGMRSHRNLFGQNVCDIAGEMGLLYDASHILWNEPFCQAHRAYNGLIRFAYFWEDGIHQDAGVPFDWSLINVYTPGLKIFNVHPIIMYLNTETDDQRRAVTNRYKDLTQAPHSEISAERNAGYGVTTFWEELLKKLSDQNVQTHHLTDLAKLHL